MVKVVKKNIYTLELEQGELDALYLILRRIGGDPNTSFRKYSDRIYYSIKNHKSIFKPVDNNPWFVNSESLIFASNTI